MARSNVTDFLNNFNAAYGLSRKVSEDFELGKVAQEKANEREEFSSEDAAQLDAASKAINPDTGKPYYDISAKDGGYEIGLSEAEHASSTLNGADAQPGPGLMLPTEKKTDFLGKTHDGKLDDSKVEGLRSRASADVMGKYDPATGLKQHAMLDQRDRLKTTQGREDTAWQQSQEEYATKQSLQAAHAKLSQAKTPEEQAAAKADLLKLPGGLDLYKQYGVTNNAIYDANRMALFRAVAPLAERGDVNGLIKAYSQYNDGQDARLGADGSIEIFDEKSGDVLHTIKYKDGKDLSNIMYRSIFPEKAAEADQKAAAEERARRAKIEDAYSTQIARNQANNTNGRTAGRTGGGSTSGNGSTPGSISMTDVAKTLSPFFMKNDPATGQVADPASYQVVRQLVPRMPSAKAGDSEGAAIEALAFYQRALDQTKGDKPAALKLIASIVAQNSQPEGGKQPAPAQPPAAPAAPVVKKEPKKQDPTIERAQLQFKKAAWGLTPEESDRLNELLQGLNTNPRTGSF